MATRFSHPQGEAQYAWLKPILDAFYISDAQVDEHLAKLARQGVTPACHKGCHACCLRPTVPFTEPELMAISWYASEVLAGETRQTVKQRLRNHDQTLECPFLVDRACSIYPVRPLICRQFLVKGQPCGVDEDITETRLDDVIPLPRDTVIRPVAMRLMDHYKFKSATAKRKAFEAGFIAQNAREMHEYNWNAIADTMGHFDNAA